MSGKTIQHVIYCHYFCCSKYAGRALLPKSASRNLSRLQGSCFMSAAPPEKRASTEIERCCKAMTWPGLPAKSWHRFDSVEYRSTWISIQVRKLTSWAGQSHLTTLRIIPKVRNYCDRSKNLFLYPKPPQKKAQIEVGCEEEKVTCAGYLSGRNVAFTHYGIFKFCTFKNVFISSLKLKMDRSCICEWRKTL